MNDDTLTKQVDCCLKRLRLNCPFFLFVGDTQYQAVINKLRAVGFQVLGTSSFCGGPDKCPDIDRLLDKICVTNGSGEQKSLVVTGLGEYLSLCGEKEIRKVVLRLKDLVLGYGRCIFILRGAFGSLLDDLRKDPRFDEHRFDVLDPSSCNLSICLADPSLGSHVLTGFKNLLLDLENGRTNEISVCTNVNMDDGMFALTRIDDAWDALQKLYHITGLPRSCGDEQLWSNLLQEVEQHGGSLDAVFEKHKLCTNRESDLYNNALGKDYVSWLAFVRLKYTSTTLCNQYLKTVAEETERFEDFAANLLNAIIEIKPYDEHYALMYEERKKLVKLLPEDLINVFIEKNHKYREESIYRLTDNTIAEQEEIITWIAEHGVLPKIPLEKLYPALAHYLDVYTFKSPVLSGLLTDYFMAYKRQKLFNTLEPEFLKQVDELAITREFNQLPSRNELIEKIEKDGTFLHWLDALGVEYLALIEFLAHKYNLSLNVQIARCELPSRTALNRDTYDAWAQSDGDEFYDKQLDSIKHGKNDRYNPQCKFSVHLASELNVIENIIFSASRKLRAKNCKRFLIASDHGASRLAVLAKNDVMYDTDTKGECSGRCCKVFHPYELVCAVEDHDYLSLADYGRFRGSRSSAVEVHGGASLEEVIVPVITLMLQERVLTVEPLEKGIFVINSGCVCVTLFFNAPVQNVRVIYDKKQFIASKEEDEQHYSVQLADIRRAGKYQFQVYVEDNLIDTVTFDAQSRGAKVNNEFDDLF